MGDPHRDRGFPHPRPAPAPPRPRAGAAGDGSPAMITIQHVFYLVGALFAAWAVLSAFDCTNPKRFGNAAFWGLVALSLLAGHHLGDLANGFLVLGLAALATFKL